MVRFVMFGAGAVGSVVGAHLARAAVDVLLIGDPLHVEKIRAQGLELTGKHGEFVTHPAVCSALADWEPEPRDIVFLCVKTYDTPVALEQLRSKVRRETPIFCLQNTMANEPLVAQHFPNTYGAALHLGARYVLPGTVGHLGGKSLVIGRYPGGVDETAEQVAAVLMLAKLEGELTEDILACKWAKFCINLLNAPCAVLDLSGVEAFNLPDSRRFMGELLEEARQVLNRAEIVLKTLPGDQPLPDTIAALRQPDFTPKRLPERSTHVFPSMWQDLFCRRGRTEARHLNGVVADMGRQRSIAAPINSLLTRVVDRMAERRELPGTYTVNALRDMLSG